MEEGWYLPVFIARKSFLHHSSVAVNTTTSSAPHFTFLFFHSRFFYILPGSPSFTLPVFPHLSFFSLPPTKTQNIIFSSQPRQKQLITRFTTFHPFLILTSRTVMFYAHTFSPLFFLFYFLVSPAKFIERLLFVLPPSLFVCEPLYATRMNSMLTRCTARAPYITSSYSSLIIIINIHRAHSINRFKVKDYNGKKSQAPRCRISMKTLIVTKR